MERDYSPFTPGTPVSVELFSGREDQIRDLVRMVRKAAAGQLAVGFMTGERGIGKSSLAKFVKELSEKNHEMLGIHVFLGGVNELEEMARRVFDRLVKDSIDRPWYEKVKNFLGNHIKDVGLFGVTVEFEAGHKELKQAVNDFAPSLRRLIKQLKGQKKGLLLILDDINGLASSTDFANWLKSLVDEIAVDREPLPLCLLLVGLERSRRELIKSQESLARVFQIVDVPVWKKEESNAFFTNAFQAIKVKINDDALARLTHWSQGLPVIAHEIGDALLKVDDDNTITDDDARKGIIRASEVIGQKYLEPKVLHAIRSEKYKGLFRIIARSEGLTFSKSELIKKISPEEKRVLNNFLTRMKNLGVIENDPDGGTGVYRFCNYIHALYFGMIAESPKYSMRNS
jgi:hypothetical protein